MSERDEAQENEANSHVESKREDITPNKESKSQDRKPKIGDSRPAPVPQKPASVPQKPASVSKNPETKNPPAGQKNSNQNLPAGQKNSNQNLPAGQKNSNNKRRKRRRSKSNTRTGAGNQDSPNNEKIELDEATLNRRRGQERKGKAVGRYTMAVHVEDGLTQIATIEGRSLLEFFVSRPADDATEIHGNVYLGRVENVLPGMEAAFVDIGTPKNAVLYQSDLVHENEKESGRKGTKRIEDTLKNKQVIICQVTKNPIAHKGARLTQEVSLAGRFVVLVPNSSTFGISKRLPEKERKRLRQILERAKPAQHGVILRTAAEDITKQEIELDVQRLVDQWDRIQKLAKASEAPALIYREPEMPFRVIREEFNKQYRSVVVDDRSLYEEASSYLETMAPALADRIEFHDPTEQELPLFERFYVNEQLTKALDSKVWLPSGGSLIIEHTEALTVVDVNTGKNVGSSNLEETVYQNNLEAAKEVARQLRLRDIGGIIVIDFVDMEIHKNRDEVLRVFREALSRDKTRTQVLGISELGLVEMTRKRIGEGLVQAFQKAQN